MNAARKVEDEQSPLAGIFIEGEEVDAPSRPLYNPACLSSRTGEVALASADQVDRAVRSAGNAFRSWSQLSVAERAKYLHDAAQRLAAVEEGTADLLTREHGKVLWESRFDVLSARSALANYATRPSPELDDVAVRDHRGSFVVSRRPLGVTAVIIPWNYPVYLGLLMAAPALLAGNTVVAKPSELAPLAVTRALREMAAALPPGVLNIVQGDGAIVGAALAEHPQVRKINFTGSVSTGRKLMHAAAEGFKRISLELGGNDPAIVLESADISDRLINEMIRGVYTSSGQICYNVKRIYVHRSRYSDFVDAFTQAASEIAVGDGFDRRSTIGPINNVAQFDKVRGMVEGARTSGARVVTVGRKVDPSAWDGGLFLLPSVVTDVAPDAEMVAEEQFGPVVPILPFDSEEEAIRCANDSEYGLAASVWSQDTDHAHEVARDIEAGSVFVNVHRIGAGASDMPFGGVKQSGFGRDSISDALHENTEAQVIAHRTDLATFPGPETFTRTSDAGVR